jgi:hypothetical protein
MGNINKGFSLLLFGILVASSLMMVESAFAQSIPKPSVPEFSVQYLSNSNYVQPTTTTDPYTGQTITRGGYYTQSTPIIKITIKNQPFTKHFDTSINKTLGLFYQVRVKGHFTQDWAVITYWDATAQNVQFPTNYPEQDYSLQYTALQYHDGIPSKGIMDFQVQAGIGTITNDANSDHWLVNLFSPNYVLSGESSGWSSTQIITIGETSSSTFTPNPTATSTQNPTPTPTQIPEFPVLVILPFFVSLLLVAVYLKHRRTNLE